MRQTHCKCKIPYCWASLMTQIQVLSLSQEHPLEKEVASHSSTLAWRIPWTEEPCGLQSMGLQRIRHDWVSNTLTLTPYC